MDTSSTPLVVVLDPGAAERDRADAVAAATEVHPGAQITKGDRWAAIAVGDGVRPIEVERFRSLRAVQRVVPVTVPYRLAWREVFGKDVPIELAPREGGEPAAMTFGGGGPIRVIVSSRWAGASEARLELLAPLLVEAGCTTFHAGRLATPGERASGAGIDIDDIRRIGDVVRSHGLALSVEVADSNQIALVEQEADVLQVGSANMQDFSLLRALGRSTRPIVVKRGHGATVEEFLLAAEYILSHGNGKVILCESGIRTFDALRKPRFEINAVPLIKHSTHLPLLADASQATTHAGVVPAVARAAIAAGADGLVLEVGTEAMYDPEGTAIDIETLRRLTAELRPIARALGRSIEPLGASEDGSPPRDPGEVLRRTERTLAQTIESIIGVPADLDVVDQWRLSPPGSAWLSPPLSPDSTILGRCTGYRMGAVRLSRNLSYVDLGRIDPTLAALLETKQLNLGQLFVDTRIEKLNFEFGTHEDAAEIDAVFRRCFPDEVDELHPYVWRRYQAAIDGVMSFVVVEALPTRVWERLLQADPALALGEGSTG
jgi:3-deoxy-7-phosphoheptulonate synthase